MLKSPLKTEETGGLFFQHNLYHGASCQAIRDSLSPLPRFFFRAKQDNLQYKKKRFPLLFCCRTENIGRLFPETFS
ncbi:MAG: hypothetical protein D3914_16990 [Candidatus Electrothrix sp. LOE2]|nr:hypothetical protein [Candidatus Electrothrix sp. LOE2]